VLVEGLQKHTGLLQGYAWYYVGAAALGIPAVVLCFILANQVKKQEARIAA